MISKHALLGTLLLASSALADHTSQPEAPLARRDGLCANDPSYTRWNLNSAASVLSGTYFNFATGIVTIPNLTGSDGGVLISTTLDSGCPTASIRVGLQGNIVDGLISWKAWAQWLPNPPVDLNAPMYANDTIRVTIIVHTPKTGKVIWRNQHLRMVTQDFNATNPLCLMNARWSVEVAADQNGRLLPLANFDTITYRNTVAKAIGTNDTYYPCGPSGYAIYGIRQNGINLANATASGTDFVVQRVK